MYVCIAFQLNAGNSAKKVLSWAFRGYYSSLKTIKKGKVVMMRKRGVNH